MSKLQNQKPSVSDEDIKTAVSDEEDHLYWKAYAAGIIFVIISLTFPGCLFYTCQPGVSNFGDRLKARSNPRDGIYLGTFNETWQCENACISVKTCSTFTFLAPGGHKDSLNGQCYGAKLPHWDPVPLKRPTGGSVVTGKMNIVSKTLQPLAAMASDKGLPFGKIVGTVTEIRKAVKEWPLFAALRTFLGVMDERTESDMWGLLYVFLLSWPLLHQILIDRHEFHKRNRLVH